MKYLIVQINNSCSSTVEVCLGYKNVRHKISGATYHFWNRTRSRTSRKLQHYLKPSLKIQLNSHTVIKEYTKIHTTCFHLKYNSAVLTPAVSVINLNAFLRQQFLIRLSLLSYSTVLYFLMHHHLQYTEVLQYVLRLKLNICHYVPFTAKILSTSKPTSSCTHFLRRL